jgi:hypothetical protein
VEEFVQNILNLFCRRRRRRRRKRRRKSVAKKSDKKTKKARTRLQSAITEERDRKGGEEGVVPITLLSQGSSC